jgi:hypothetical protein
MLNRSSLLLYSVILFTVFKYGGYPVYSMNKTGGRRKLLTTSATVEGAEVQHLLKLLFWGKNIYNYEHCCPDHNLAGSRALI